VASLTEASLSVDYTLRGGDLRRAISRLALGRQAYSERKRSEA